MRDGDRDQLLGLLRQRAFGKHALAERLKASWIVGRELLAARAHPRVAAGYTLSGTSSSSWVGIAAQLLRLALVSESIAIQAATDYRVTHPGLGVRGPIWV